MKDNSLAHVVASWILTIGVTAVLVGIGYLVLHVL